MVEAALFRASAASAPAIDIRTASCPCAAVSSPRNKHTLSATEAARRLHCSTGRDFKFRISVTCSQRVATQLGSGLWTFWTGATMPQLALGARGNSPGPPHYLTLLI